MIDASVIIFSLLIRHSFKKTLSDPLKKEEYRQQESRKSKKTKPCIDLQRKQKNIIIN